MFKSISSAMKAHSDSRKSGTLPADTENQEPTMEWVDTVTNKPFWIRSAVENDFDRYWNLKNHIWQNTFNQITDDQPEFRNTTKAIPSLDDGNALLILALPADDMMSALEWKAGTGSPPYGHSVTHHHNDGSNCTVRDCAEIPHAQGNAKAVILGAFLIIPFTGDRRGWINSGHAILHLNRDVVFGSYERKHSVAKALIEEGVARIQDRVNSYLSLTAELSYEDELCFPEGSEEKGDPEFKRFAHHWEECGFVATGRLAKVAIRQLPNGEIKSLDRVFLQRQLEFTEEQSERKFAGGSHVQSGVYAWPEEVYGY